MACDSLYLKTLHPPTFISLEFGCSITIVIVILLITLNQELPLTTDNKSVLNGGEIMALLNQLKRTLTQFDHTGFKSLPSLLL